MRKIFLPLMGFSTAVALVIATPAQANVSVEENNDTHAISVGYAQSRVEHFKDIRGVNLKYRYEAQAPVGLIASFTWQSGERDESGSFPDGHHWRDNVEVKYWSLMAGPAMRVNDYVSFYALAGVGTVKADMKEYISTPDYSETLSGSKSKSGFGWGAGVQFNPVENMVVDAGYEGSKIDTTKLNGFIVGVGYRF